MVKNLSDQNLSGYLSRKTIHPQMKSRINFGISKTTWN